MKIDKNQISEIFKSCGLNTSDNIWNKTAITPGTLFMKNLNIGVKKYFNSKKIIISGSDIPGEGEHKIFEYIRNNKDKHKHLSLGMCPLNCQ